MGPRKLKILPKLIQKEQPMAKAVSQIEKTPSISALPELSPEAASLLEHQEDRQRALDFLKSKEISVGSLDQLKFPETIHATIDDPELAKYATDLGKALRAEAQAKALAKKNALEAVKEGASTRRPSILTKQQMLEKRKEDALAEETKKRLQKEFEETKAEGVRDIDLSKLKSAAGAGAAAVGAGLLGSEDEAEAARYDRIPRKVIESLLKKSRTFDDFLNSLKYETKTSSQLASQDVLHHLILDRTGLPEGKEVDAIRSIYPETENIPIDPDLLGYAKKYKDTYPDHYKDLINSFGIYTADPLNIGKQNPRSGKIFYDPDKFKQGGLGAVLAHEAEHLRDDILSPGKNSIPYASNWRGFSKNLLSVLDDKKLSEINNLANIYVKTPQEQLSAPHITKLFKIAAPSLNQILSIEDLLSMGTHKHHVNYPKNYELQKARELVEKGIVPVNKNDLLSRMNQLSADYLKKANQDWFGKKAAGIAAATGVGAGTLAASPSAQASEGPTVSQSNPEFTPDAAQTESKHPLSHFEQKYGTYDIPGGAKKLLENVDKYTGRPVRAAALAALEGKNPLTGAVESVSKDEDVEGQQVARQFLENLEEKSGMRLRAPRDKNLEKLQALGLYAPQQPVGSVDIDPDSKSLTNRVAPLIKRIQTIDESTYDPSEFPSEAALGFAADAALDPTNLAGMGLGTKVGRSFSKIRGLVK